jgi:WD40 repeat protein
VAIQTIAFSADGKSLISGDAGGLALLWDLVAGGDPQMLAGNTAGIRSIAFSPRAPLAVTGSDDATVRLWDTVHATEVYSFTVIANDNTISSVAFSPDGTLLAAGDGKGQVTVWDVQSREQRTQLLEPNQYPISALAFSPDGSHLAVGSQDVTAYLFSLDGGDPIPLMGHAGSVSSLAFSHKGDRIATASTDDTVRFWDAATGAPEPFALRSILDPASLSFSADDAQIALVPGGSAEAAIYPLSRQALIDLAHSRLTRGLADLECETYAINAPCP